MTSSARPPRQKKVYKTNNYIVPFRVEALYASVSPKSEFKVNRFSLFHFSDIEMYVSIDIDYIFYFRLFLPKKSENRFTFLTIQLIFMIHFRTEVFKTSVLLKRVL
jgi:hypothetical protein